MPITVSVIIASYNAQEFIAETLGSVLRQSVPPSEIIVVDDASRDSTVAVITGLANEAPVPIRVIQSAVNAGGPAVPLNVGIEAASSELIATLDHDDRMRPRRLERQVACWEAEPSISLVLGRCEIVGGGERERRVSSYVESQYQEMRSRRLTLNGYLIPTIRAREASVEGCFALTCSSFLFPKSTWKRAGGFDPDLRLSCDFGFQVAATAVGDLAYIDEPINDWIVRGDSLYHSAGILSRISERIAVLARLDAEWDRLDEPDRLSQALAEEWISYAFHARESRRYREALLGYLKGAREKHSRKTAILGALKLGPHMLTRRLHARAIEGR